ncbi:MAG: winged helix-turn-helix transcriptional regulator [Planctomycetes bacterium]|nr:winged helix-turn-helix transcriptional regulator [Planctomycetota bacterium]
MLNLLMMLESNPSWSQHRLAEEVGTYSNTVNRIMKGLVDDGLVEMRGSTNRTTTYHITEEGRDLKRKLLNAFSTEIIQLYGKIKRDIEGTLAPQLRGFEKKNIAVFGAAETGEVVVQALVDLGYPICAVFDNDVRKQGRHLGGVRIESLDRIFSKPSEFDALIVASYSRGAEMFDEVCSLIAKGIKVIRLQD